MSSSADPAPGPAPTRRSRDVPALVERAREGDPAALAELQGGANARALHLLSDTAALPHQR